MRCDLRCERKEAQAQGVCPEFGKAGARQRERKAPRFSPATYNLVADVIADALSINAGSASDALFFVAQKLATKFEIDNEKFERARFLKACGYHVEIPKRKAVQPANAGVIKTRRSEAKRGAAREFDAQTKRELEAFDQGVKRALNSPQFPRKGGV